MNNQSNVAANGHAENPHNMSTLANERKRQKEETLQWIADHALQSLRQSWTTSGNRHH